VSSARFVLLLAGAILSVILVIAPFTGTFRHGSVWLRTTLLVGGVLVCTWAILGFAAELQMTALPRLLLDSRGDIGGVGVGILIAVGTSSEFRTHAGRKSTSNKSLEPTRWPLY
jgi:hypothetical protein